MKSERYSGLHFKDVDISTLDSFTHKLRTDKDTFKAFKADPLGELRKLGVNIEPNSVMGRRILHCAGNQSGEVILERQGCIVFPSGDHCLIIPIPPEDPPEPPEE